MTAAVLLYCWIMLSGKIVKNTVKQHFSFKNYTKKLTAVDLYLTLTAVISQLKEEHWIANLKIVCGKFISHFIAGTLYLYKII